MLLFHGVAEKLLLCIRNVILWDVYDLGMCHAICKNVNHQ
jgi:hypothetical protein